MISKIFSIAALYLRTTYTSRSTLLLSILMPLIFTYTMGVAMNSFKDDAPPESYSLWVVDEDQSDLSASLIAKLEVNLIVDLSMSDETTAREAVENGEALAALLIPSGFETRAFQPASVKLTFFRSADSIMRAQILQEAVNAASTELAGSLAIADLSLRIGEEIELVNATDTDAAQVYRQEAFSAAESVWDTSETLTLKSQPVTRLETNANTIPLGTEQSSPGMLVMFALFFSFGGGATLLVEREEGTLRRLLVMPLSKGALMGGKLLGVFLGALLQMTIMILFGTFILDLAWGQSPLALAVILLSYAFASTALGLMVAALVKSAAQADAAGMIIVMALASLGGAWWPIEIVPAWMQKIALVLPTGWAMRGFQDIIVRGLGLQEILLEAVVLIGFGLLFLIIGIWRFRYE